MHSLKTIIATAAGTLLLSVASAAGAADLIDVQFSRDHGLTQTGAAAVGSSGDYWNEFIGNASGAGSLLSTSGADSGVNLSFASALVYSSAWQNTQFTGTSAANLMQGYLVDYGSTGIDLKFSGLAAGQEYGLWVYAQGDNNGLGRQMSLTVNGSSPLVVTQTNANTLTLGENYFYLTTYADANGVVDLFGSEVKGEANINGVQLIAVPEPSSITLMMAGAALLACAAMRKSRAR